jgi:hypothetical protein
MCIKLPLHTHMELKLNPTNSLSESVLRSTTSPLPTSRGYSTYAIINPANPATAATPAIITRSTEAPPVNAGLVVGIVTVTEADVVVALVEVIVTTLEELAVEEAPEEEAAEDDAEEEADDVELAP